jgi:multisubunit Na+/H+ antiporter MnhG subunit
MEVVPLLVMSEAFCLLIGYVFSRLLNASKATCFAVMTLVAVISVFLFAMMQVDLSLVPTWLFALIWLPIAVALASAILGSLAGRAQNKQGDDLHRLAAKSALVGAGIAMALWIFCGWSVWYNSRT